MKIKKVELNAFRAYKNKVDGTFDFTIDNGNKIANFISIYAPNGFGKTSFYDGVEWVMTNQVSRLDKGNFDEYAEAEKKNLLAINGTRAKQYILKNKDAQELIASAKVYTNNGDFHNESDEVIRGGKDYPPKTKPKNEFFRSVILSQNGIANFLNEDNEKERYKKFIKSFGDGKLAQYHENITKLEKKNRYELDKINENIANVKEILKEPVDEQIFNFANEKRKELERFGINFEEIDSHFNDTKRLSFESVLSEQKKLLSTKIDSFKTELENLPSWLENSNNYFNNKNEFQKTESRLKDYEDFDRSQKTIKFLKQEIQKNQQLRNKYDQLSKIYPIYKTIIDDITVKEKEQVTKITEKNENEKNYIQATSTLSEIIKQIQLIESQKKQFTDLLQSAPEIYSNILELSDKFQRSKSDLDTQRKAIEQFQASMKLLSNTKDKFKLVIESIGKNVFRDIGLSDNYDETVKQIEILRQENESKLKELNDKIEKQKQNKQYDAQIKDLLSLGIEVIEKNQTNACPLCHEKQDSFQILKSKILNNQFLDDIEKELVEQTEQIKLEIKNNESKINVLKDAIISDHNKKVQEIETKLTILDLKTKAINLDSLQKDINDQDALLTSLLRKTESKSKDDFIASRNKGIHELSDKLARCYEQKNEIEKLLNESKGKAGLYNLAIKNIEDAIAKLKENEEYKTVSTFAQQFFDNSADFKLKLDELIELNKKLIIENVTTLETENKLSDILIAKYNLIDIDSFQNDIQELKSIISNILSGRLTFESSYENYFKNKVTNFEQAKYDVEAKRIEIEKRLINSNKCIELINTLNENLSNLLKYLESKNKQKELAEYTSEFNKKNGVSSKIFAEKKQLEDKINKDVESFFHEELINQIYSKIDPHPDYKKVSFKCSFENGVGKLNVFVTDENDDKPLSPSLFYSTAQLNVLSLSIFLAKALHAKDNKGNPVDCIFIDDPIQAMDSINILSTIDLLRSLVANYNKQIILSTHDENFHRLLEKKISPEYFDSKFIELETFGKVKI